MVKKLTNEKLEELLLTFGEGEYQPLSKINQYVKHPIRLLEVMNRIDDINSLYKTLRACTWLKTLNRAPSGAIRKSYENCAAWDIQKVTAKNNVLKGIIITVRLNGCTWVIKCGHLQASPNSTSTGVKSFKRFREECLKEGIDLDSYMTTPEEGAVNKLNIESPYIVNFKLGVEYDHVNHIDFHRAWPSCMCEKYPEFESICSTLDSKYILNPALGYMQSKYCKNRLAQLPLAGINGNNAKIQRIIGMMKLQGFEVLGINTDGIWYRHPDNILYHDELEGQGLHHWEHDHIDVSWYASSNGQYYFVEDNKINVRLRGTYEYEKIKPRDKWDSKDDYFNAIASFYLLKWDDEEGFITNYDYEI